MKRLLKIGTNAVLIIIIIVLVLYIVIQNKPSVLNVALNLVLKKYSFTSSFENIKVKSPTDIQISDIELNKKGLYAYVGSLSLSVDKKGYISAAAKDCNIKIKKKDKSGKGSSFKLIPLKLKNLSIDNLSLTYDSIKLKSIYASLINNTISLKGNIVYKTPSLLLDASIDNLSGTIKLSSSGIYIEDLYIKPNKITLIKDNATLRINQPIRLRNIYINISPFYIKLNELNTSALIGFNRYTVSFKATLSYEKGRIKAKLNDIKEADDLFEAEAVNLTAEVKKNSKSQLTFSTSPSTTQQSQPKTFQASWNLKTTQYT
ncbi:hypothetical protein [Hippea sp. KM1]|uniref:hypothetical protein n=1 Tax=Hippea sp. KM1 TaxID=944481 RepID=UPI00046D67E3|nr:hypothetical protein [Hippea sp. KM1]